MVGVGDKGVDIAVVIDIAEGHTVTFVGPELLTTIGEESSASTLISALVDPHGVESGVTESA